GSRPEPESSFELPPELPAAAFGEERVFAVQLHSGLVGGGLLAVLADAHVAGSDAFDLRAVIKNLDGGEAGEDLDARGLGLLAQPAGEIAEADDVIAVVLEAGRKHPARSRDRAVLGQEKKAVPGDRHAERRALRFAVREELDDRA